MQEIASSNKLSGNFFFKKRKKKVEGRDYGQIRQACTQTNKYIVEREIKRGSQQLLETNEIAMCVFEELMTAQEGCSGLFNTYSGANCLILRLCAWFDKIDKNPKAHLSTNLKFLQCEVVQRSFSRSHVSS